MRKMSAPTGGEQSAPITMTQKSRQRNDQIVYFSVAG
jgi:hypothetical protein